MSADLRIVWRKLPGLLTVALLISYSAFAEGHSSYVLRYSATYQTARTNWLANTTDTSLAWQFSRSTFDLAEFATNDTRRAELAREGIDAAKAAIKLDEKCAPAHYYLAMNLGQRARTELLGALRLVSEMEKQFKLVAKLDPQFDYAGAERNLGILYREAPGWPASIGSRSKARAHLKKASEICPSYPANQLELFQAYLDWKDFASARKLLSSVEKCLTDARKVFVGDAWDLSWMEWENQWESLKHRLPPQNE